MTDITKGASILTIKGEIFDDIDPSSVRYCWGDEFGKTYGTSYELARTALRSGLFEGVVLATDETLLVVAAPVRTDLELYGEVASQYWDTHAVTPVLGSTAFNPEFVGMVCVEQDPTLQLDSPEVEAAVAAYTSVIDRAA